MKAQEYLEALEKLDTIIENKMIERELWKAKATRVTQQMSQDRVQSSGNPHKLEDAVLKIVEIDEEIANYIGELAKQEKEIVGTIERLPKVHYDVLHMLYVQHRAFEDVADKYGKTYSWATTTHGRALEALQQLLDEAA